MQCDDIVHGISQMLQGTSRPGSSHIRLCLVKLQSHSNIPFPAPAAEPDLSPLLKSKHVEPVRYYLCKEPPHLITLDISDSDEDMVTATSSVEE